MNESVFWKILPFVLIVIVVGLLMFLKERARRRALNRLVQHFQGRLSWLTGAFQARFQGFDFFITLVPQGKNTPPKLAVRFLKHFTFNLRISKETSLARIGKRLGLVREVQINDSDFDRNFLIFSNRPVQAVNFLSMSAKNTLREIFNDGFTVFSLDHRGIAVQKPYYSLENDLAPEKVELLLRRLLSLAGGTA